MIRYWLIKSEPSTWSWNDQSQAHTTAWTGVRNYQARKFLQQMKGEDLVFFYHSNHGKEIVGIVKVTKPYYPDPTDETKRFGCVDVEMVRPLKRPVSLDQIKATEGLETIPLVRQSRLSVMPLTKEEWETILNLENP